VETFKKILQKNNIVLPKIITEDITPEQLDHMAELTLMNEKPLSNAFGPEWRSVFGKEKVIELLKRM
jgi:3-deoxy-alpha-D-manno-octulosonate 8-oxidase